MGKKIVMLLFVGLAVGMSIPASRAQILEKVSPLTDKFGTAVAEGQLEKITDQLAFHVNRTGKVPTGEVVWKNWLEKTYTGASEDPWGNLYWVRDDRRGRFTVGSMGPDGELGTEDDLLLSYAGG